MSEEDMDRPKRRAVLKKTGAAVAAGAIIPGATAANPGNGKGPGKGKGGPGHGKGGPGNGKGGPGNGKGGPGNGKGHGAGKGGGPGEGKGPGGDGPPGKKFATPDTEHVVFCGCSQVCVCNAGCGAALVLVEGEDGDRIVMNMDDPSKPDIPGCVEVDEGRIVGVQDTGYPGNVICNPNLACGSFDGGEYKVPKKGCDGGTQEYNVYEQDECTYGTAPQFGARCGDAFLRSCSTEGKR